MDTAPRLVVIARSELDGFHRRIELTPRLVLVAWFAGLLTGLAFALTIAA